MKLLTSDITKTPDSSQENEEKKEIITNPFNEEKRNMENNLEQMFKLRDLAEKLGSVREFNEMRSAGKTVEEINNALLDVALRQESPKNASGNAYEVKDVAGYDIAKAMSALRSGDWQKAGLEREVSEDLKRKLGKSDSFFMPTSFLRANEMTTASKGTSLVFDKLVEAVDLLRNRTWLS